MEDLERLSTPLNCRRDSNSVFKTPYYSNQERPSTYSAGARFFTGPFNAHANRERAMRILEAEPKALNNEQLHELIVSLQRSERDFEKRLAGQVGALERAGRMHGSDPVYQSLFFLLRKFTKQLGRAEKEVASRDVDMSASVLPRGRAHSQSIQRRFDRRAVEQSSPPSNFARAMP
jgi:hypothetical protein